jgi:hypothetical protein
MKEGGIVLENGEESQCYRCQCNMVQEPIEKSQRRSSILRGDASPAINKGISKGIVL